MSKKFELFLQLLQLLLQERIKIKSVMYDPILTSVESTHTIQEYTLAEITNDCEQGLNVSKQNFE